MANCILAYPNYIDVEATLPSVPVYVRIGGGDWLTARPLTNLRAVTDTDRFLINTARSTDDATASTQFVFDMGVTRSVLVTAIPKNNLSTDATVRVRYMTAPRFTGCTVNTNAAAAATAVSFLAPAGGATITSGDYFTINNDTTVYKSTTTAVIAGGANASINITPALSIDITAGQVISCITGDTSTTVYDSGATDVWRVAFDISTLSYYDPHFYNGKFTAEEMLTINMPWYDVADAPFFARYGLLEINDTSNPDGYVDLAKFMVTPGYQPTSNPVFGLTFGWKSNTTVTQSDITKFFNIRNGSRISAFQFDYLPLNEAFGNDYEIKRSLDVHGSLFFILDPDEVENRHRTAMLCNLSTVSPLAYTNFDLTTTAYELEEIIS